MKIEIDIPDDVLKELDREASIHDLTRDQAITAAAQAWLKDWMSWHKKHCGPQAPGPVSLLREHGFTRREATIASKMAQITPEKFTAAIQAPIPPAPSQVTAVNVIPHHLRCYADLVRLHGITGHYTPKEFFDGLQKGNIEKRAQVRSMLEDIVDWAEALGEKL